MELSQQVHAIKQKDEDPNLRHYEIEFDGHDGRKIRVALSLPGRRTKTPLILTFNDYYELPRSYPRFLSAGFAHATVELRGHEVLLEQQEHHRRNEKNQPPPPSFFSLYGLRTIEMSYPYAAFLDAIRCVEAIRQQKSVSIGPIILHGRGFGAAMATFVAWQSSELSAIFLDKPSFVWLERFLKESASPLADEMRNYLNQQSGPKRSESLKKLAYLDLMHLSEELNLPVYATVSRNDRLRPPQLVFGFFNHIRSQKCMEILEETPGGEEKWHDPTNLLAFCNDVISGKK